MVIQRQLEPEDQARADFYALLARLYARAPDAALLAALAHAQPLTPAIGADDAGGSASARDDAGGGPATRDPAGEDASAIRDAGAGGLAASWDKLRAASGAMDPEAATDEYHTLFVGVGRSEVSLYASHYLGPQSGRPLAEIRAALAELNLARQAGSSEFEDHLAVMLETMRMLVAGDAAREPATIAEQRRFFERHIAPWAFACCTAIRDSSVANYYGRVAQFTSCFLALERDSLAME